jgi:hypothetical protein
VDPDVSRALLPGDSFFWKRIFSNLLNNSSEAAGKDPLVVEIGAHRKDGALFLEVRDNGCGIPAKILSKIGTKGYSYGKGRISGLGLASALSYVESLGGKMKVESEEGKCTSVQFFFPPEKDAVLIDDDAALGVVWKKVAEKRGIRFKHFLSPEDFLQEQASFPRATVVYLDVEFPRSSSPSAFGSHLQELGFQKVFLTTGHPREKFKGLKGIRGVLGKEPPW